MVYGVLEDCKWVISVLGEWVCGMIGHVCMHVCMLRLCMCLCVVYSSSHTNFTYLITLWPLYGLPYVRYTITVVRYEYCRT